jgi:hypothetical protein
MNEYKGGPVEVFQDLEKPLGHVYEGQGGKFVDIFHDGGYETWRLGDIDADDRITMEIQARVPVLKERA